MTTIGIVARNNIGIKANSALAAKQCFFTAYLFENIQITGFLYP